MLKSLIILEDSFHQIKNLAQHWPVFANKDKGSNRALVFIFFRLSLDFDMSNVNLLVACRTLWSLPSHLIEVSHLVVFLSHYSVNKNHTNNNNSDNKSLE